MINKRCKQTERAIKAKRDYYQTDLGEKKECMIYVEPVNENVKSETQIEKLS